MKPRYIYLAAGFLTLEALLIVFVDRPLALFMHELAAQQPAFIDIFRAYTVLGKSDWYLWPTGLGGIICWVLAARAALAVDTREKLKRVAIMLGLIFACVAISGIAADIIKPILGRARPVLLEREGVYGFFPLSFAAARHSMPSGHTTTGFALAVAVMGFFPRWRLPLLSFAIAIGLSRVMVNAHYAGDVMAGAALGTIISLLIWAQFQQRGWLPEKPPAPAPIDPSAG